MAALPPEGISVHFGSRERVLVRFRNDPELWYARWILSRKPGLRQACVLTPHREVQDMRLSKKLYGDVIRWADSVWSHIRVIQSSEHEGTLVEYHGKDATDALYLDMQTVGPAQAPRRRLRFKGSSDRASGENSPDDEGRGNIRVAPLPDGPWISLFEAESGDGPGSYHLYLPLGCVFVGQFAIFQSSHSRTGCRKIPGVYMDASAHEVGQHADKMRMAHLTSPFGSGGAFAFCKDLEDGEGETWSYEPNWIHGPDVPKPSKGSRIIQDFKMLQVLIDVGGERWRAFEESAPLLVRQDFLDWPLQCKGSTKYVVTQLRRSHSALMSSQQKWVDRVYRSRRLKEESQTLRETRLKEEEMHTDSDRDFAAYPKDGWAAYT